MYKFNKIARFKQQCGYSDEEMFGDFTNLVQDGPRPRGYWLWFPVAAHIDCSISAIWDVMQDIVSGEGHGVQDVLEEAKTYLLNFGLIGKAIANSTTYRISGAAGLRGVYKKLAEDVPQGLVIEFEFPKRPDVKGIIRYLLENLEYESELANRNRLCITRYIEWCKFKALNITINETMSKQPDALFADAVCSLLEYDKRFYKRLSEWDTRYEAAKVLTDYGWTVERIFIDSKTYRECSPNLKFGEHYLQITRPIPEYLGIPAKPCNINCRRFY